MERAGQDCRARGRRYHFDPIRWLPLLGNRKLRLRRGLFVLIITTNIRAGVAVPRGYVRECCRLAKTIEKELSNFVEPKLALYLRKLGGDGFQPR